MHMQISETISFIFARDTKNNSSETIPILCMYKWMRAYWYEHYINFIGLTFAIISSIVSLSSSVFPPKTKLQLFCLKKSRKSSWYCLINFFKVSIFQDKGHFICISRTVFIGVIMDKLQYGKLGSFCWESMSMSVLRWKKRFKKKKFINVFSFIWNYP